MRGAVEKAPVLSVEAALPQVVPPVFRPALVPAAAEAASPVVVPPVFQVPSPLVPVEAKAGKPVLKPAVPAVRAVRLPEA